MTGGPRDEPAAGRDAELDRVRPPDHVGSTAVPGLAGSRSWTCGVGALGDRDEAVAASVAAYTEGAEAYETAHASKLADRAARFAASLPVPSLVLDAGCGPGRDLARFTRHGHVARGVELNPAFVARARTCAPVLAVDLREVGRCFPTATFDGVWAAASLVHLSHAEAAAVLRDFASLLRPGGRLFVSVRSTGNTGWLDEPDGRRWYSVWEPEAVAAEVVAAGLHLDEVEPGPYTEVWAHR